MRRDSVLYDSFPALKNGRGGEVVYVAEFTNGAIKVGMSSGVRHRIPQVVCHARRLFGYVHLKDIYVSKAQKRSATVRSAEFFAKYSLKRIGQVTPGTSEYFTGISFNDAVCVVQEALQRAMKPL